LFHKGADDPAALIAMSTHGRAGIERWFLGSAAHKVLHTASHPLLLVRPMDESKSKGPIQKCLQGGGKVKHRWSALGSRIAIDTEHVGISGIDDEMRLAVNTN
jgi:hypothetical protein